MKCVQCNSEWKTDESVSSSLTKCPFCGKDLPKKEEPKSYENTKDALAAIKKQFGDDVLLGKLNALFPDLAPSVSNADKRLVYSVYETGASKVLKNNLNTSQENKEAAVKTAVQRLKESYIDEGMSIKIIFEFASALGWKIEKPEIKPENEIKSKSSKTEEIKESKESDNEKTQANEQPTDNSTVTAHDDNPPKNVVYTGTMKRWDAFGEYNYTGDIKNKLMHGKGVIKWENGDVYEGDFNEGRRAGKGKLTFANGDIYEGNFLNDSRTGKGKFIWKNGDVFEGIFFNGKISGKGKMIYRNGTVKEGIWSEGKLMSK